MAERLGQAMAECKHGQSGGRVSSKDSREVTIVDSAIGNIIAESIAQIQSNRVYMGATLSDRGG